MIRFGKLTYPRGNISKGAKQYHFQKDIKINWKEVISILKKYNYDKTITLEVFKSDKDLLKSREYFRKLWY